MYPEAAFFVLDAFIIPFKTHLPGRRGQKRNGHLPPRLFLVVVVVSKSFTRTKYLINQFLTIVSWEGVQARRVLAVGFL